MVHLRDEMMQPLSRLLFGKSLVVKKNAHDEMFKKKI